MPRFENIYCQLITDQFKLTKIELLLVKKKKKIIKIG